MKALQKILNIKHPIIMAPMFLVSNVKMVVEGMKSGIAGCIPALNYRTIEELESAIKELKKQKVEGGAFGFNLIVNKSNVKYKKQLETICKHGADFIITSLGSPKETIEEAHKVGIKVFCDVTDVMYAKKVEALGADAIIAVNNEAGGHRGNISPEELLPLLKKECKTPIISAGGVGNKEQLDKMLALGAEGVSIGSPFIASTESKVSDEYKQACVEYGQGDIVMTEKISGTPCTVINTPYMKSIGTKTSSFERFLNKNKTLKKYVKMFRFFKGMNSVTKAATEATYKTVWVAGPSIQETREITSISNIIKRFV